MAKREISSTLKNLKFMQRATQREEKTKKVEVEVIPDGNFPSSSTPRKWQWKVKTGMLPLYRQALFLGGSNLGKLASKSLARSVVIVEGDPHPGATRGRMSFQSFNPSVDKLNEEAANSNQPVGLTTFSGNQGRGSSSRENGSAWNGTVSLKLDRNDSDTDANEDLKRKQAEVISEVPYPNKTLKNVQGQQDSISSSRSSHKLEKLD